MTFHSFVNIVFYIVSPKSLFLACTNECFCMDLLVCFSQPAPRFVYIRRFCYFSYKLTMQPFLLPAVEFLMVPRCLEFIFAHCFLSPNYTSTPYSLHQDFREFFTYHPKLFFSLLIHLSQLINPRPPLTRDTYNLSTLLFGWKAPFVVNTFLVILSNVFSSSFVHLIISAPYLSTETAQV